MRPPALSALFFAALLVACSSDGTTPPDDRPGPAAALDIVAGNQQTGVVGAELSSALTVRLTDDAGQAIPGRPVTFAVVSGGGSLLLPTATTDASGRAADRWTLGTSSAAAQRVEARLVDAETGRGFTVSFSATPVAADPAQIVKMDGDEQAGRPAAALEDSVAVAVTDSYGNPVAGASVTWTAMGGGAASPATSTTDAQGVASTRWTLGPSEDEAQALEASLGELAAVTFTAAFHEVSIEFDAGSWERVADLPNAIRAAAAATDGSRVYVFGGTDVLGRRRPYTQIYDPSTDRWSLAASMPIALDFATASAAADGIHVLGGTADSGRTSSHFVYHPDTGAWSVGPALPVGVSGASGRTVGDEIVIVGGVTGSRDRHSELQVFDRTTALWTFGPAHPEAHLNAGGELIGGLIFVAGGNIEGLATSAMVYALDPQAGTWAAWPPMPVQRESLGVGSTRGNLCVFGGRIAKDGGFNTPFTDAFCYDFTSGRWRGVARMPMARAEIASVTLDGWVYAIGGHDDTDRAQSSVLRFTGRPVTSAPYADRGQGRPFR